MDRRFVLFFALAIALTVGYSYVMHVITPPPPRRVAVKPDSTDKASAPAAAEKAKKEEKKAAAPAPAKPAESKSTASEPEPAEQWVTLGSVDPDSQNPYRMLVTLTNRGAAVVRMELSSPRFRDLDDRSGYLGHLVMEGNLDGSVCRLDMVGTGSPAAKAGLRPGDVIEKLNGAVTPSGRTLEQLLKRTKPGQKITLDILRDGKPQQVTDVALIRRPLEVTRPEADDPLSFLLTLAQVDEEKIGEAERKLIDNSREFPGLALRTGNWRLEQGVDQVTFRRALPKWNLEVSKTYRLNMIPDEQRSNDDARAYHLTLEIGLRNLGSAARKVAYQLDGPTGLPTEGYWYASKVSGALRDCVVSFSGKKAQRVDSATIADDKIPAPWEGEPLSFIGVDAQYFAVALIPQHPDPQQMLIARSQALRVGKIDPASEWKKNVDVSCRVVSALATVEPGAELAHQYEVFAGPKRPELVDQYHLTGLLDYGWFDFVAIPMLKALHFFYAGVRNYGVAIIMLTVLVRLCMFPLSRKQALGAQKMQEIQPELKKIQEKYKKEPESLRKAQMELFRKHNYHPLSGCLPVVIQLPIFIGLYRSLMVDVELRQAPLLSESIRWCSNLAAPDMLFDWSSFMPEFISSGSGMLGLGPYFNLLPILTIVLFLWQQKQMMPPPADEQAAMQQKVMKYMMIFMGLLFFKVASGLCVYFIASSLWGLAERKFLPKFQHPHGPGTSPAPLPVRSTSHDGPSQRRRNRDRR